MVYACQRRFLALVRPEASVTYGHTIILIGFDIRLHKQLNYNYLHYTSRNKIISSGCLDFAKVNLDIAEQGLRFADQ